jgi:hypothetical protein
MAEETTDQGIKNLTGVANKKLTAAQRQNKRTAKASGITDVNYDGVPDQDQLDVSSLSADLQWITKIIDSDPQLKEIFEESSRLGFFEPEAGQAGLNNFQNKIMGSTWWQENNQYARAAFKLQKTDPAAYATSIENSKDAVKAQAQAMGFELSDATLNTLAEQRVNDGWDNPERAFKLTAAIGDASKNDPATTAQPKGDLRGYAMQLRNTASANGLQFSDEYYDSQARSAVTGLNSIDDLDMNIREQAASFWPSYSDKILAGQNVRDLASSYLYTMGTELEIDPQSINLDDQYIRGALTSVDDKGNFKPQSLWEFQQSLRKDPRWMNTTKAQNQVASTASRVMEMFGLVG